MGWVDRRLGKTPLVLFNNARHNSTEPWCVNPPLRHPQHTFTALLDARSPLLRPHLS